MIYGLKTISLHKIYKNPHQFTPEKQILIIHIIK